MKGIIVHEGISEAGHYFSLIRIKNRWIKFNDSYVAEVDREEVEAMGFGEQTGRNNRNAYLLFYEKKSSNN